MSTFEQFGTITLLRMQKTFILYSPAPLSALLTFASSPCIQISLAHDVTIFDVLWLALRQKTFKIIYNQSRPASSDASLTVNYYSQIVQMTHIR